MNYEEMSDFEINRKVAAVLGIEMGMVQSSNNKFGTVNLLNGRIFNPCNNSSDVWPIILKHGITIEFDDNANFQNAYICHEEGYPDFEHGFDTDDCDEKPLRAACICFLKMKELENG